MRYPKVLLSLRLPLLSLALAAISLLLGCTSPETASEPGDAAASAADAIDQAALLRDVEVLAADEMGGRGTGTEGETKAAAYIESRFQEVGLAPLNGSYRQDFELVGTRKVADASPHQDHRR